VGRPKGSKSQGHHCKNAYAGKVSQSEDGEVHDDHLANGYDARYAGKPRKLYTRKKLNDYQYAAAAEYARGWDLADAEIKHEAQVKARFPDWRRPVVRIIPHGRADVDPA
jgi:hypothetical protein